MSPGVATERIDRAIAAIDHELAGIVDAVLHEPQLQRLEAAWRGLAYVVERVDATENIEIAFWSYTKEDAAEDFEGEPDVTRTRFFRWVYTAEYGQHGGRPFSAIFANWEASPAPADVDLLSRLASVAAMAHAPLLLGASPALLRVRSFAELQSMSHPEGAFDGPGSERWASFRATEDSRYVGVLLPRVLLRLPHREMSGSASRFVYDERALRAGDFLWGSPVFAFAVRIADSFARYRSFAGILGADDEAPPLFDSHPALGTWHVKPPVEVMLSRRLEQSLSDLGLIPLTWDPVRTTLRFTSASSVQLPKSFGSGEGGPAATLGHLLGTRLPHLLLVSRFAHYLKVLERERLGSARESGEIERDLNTWISQYVVVMDGAPAATRLKYPLRNARVTVSEVDGSPGIHRMEVKLQPHLRYMRQAFTLSVDGRLEAR
ncbi:MAG TPA: type VI secretion system contractile sheath large subunit [Polyangiaceae bacterium]|jgi:type VI secretion system protein ImpC